jgi:hypothetical protein
MNRRDDVKREKLYFEREEALRPGSGQAGGRREEKNHQLPTNS